MERPGAGNRQVSLAVGEELSKHEEWSSWGCTEAGALGDAAPRQASSRCPGRLWGERGKPGQSLVERGVAWMLVLRGPACNGAVTETDIGQHSGTCLLDTLSPHTHLLSQPPPSFPRSQAPGLALPPGHCAVARSQVALRESHSETCTPCTGSGGQSEVVRLPPGFGLTGLMLPPVRPLCDLLWPEGRYEGQAPLLEAQRLGRPCPRGTLHRSSEINRRLPSGTDNLEGLQTCTLPAPGGPCGAMTMECSVLPLPVPALHLPSRPLRSAPFSENISTLPKLTQGFRVAGLHNDRGASGDPTWQLLKAGPSQPTHPSPSLTTRGAADLPELRLCLASRSARK